VSVFPRMSALAGLGGPAGRTIVSNAGAIGFTMIASSFLGYPYWWLAARQFPPAAVGFAAACTSAMTLLGSLGMLGLGTLIVAELPNHRGREITLISTALAGATVPAIALGAIFALAGSLVSTDFAALASPLPLLLFAIGTGLTAAGLILDQAYIGMLRGGLQIVRYLIFGAGKLAVLALLALLVPSRVGLVILLSWVVGGVLSMATLQRLIAARGGGSLRSILPDWRLLRGQGRVAFEHHILNTGLQFPTLVLPVMVTVLLSATDNAYFYAAFTIAALGFLVCGALTSVLYAMGVREPHALARHTRFTLTLGFLCAVLAGLGLLVLADPILSLVFGTSYAEHASPLLRILIVGVAPVAIIDHYVALCRIQRRSLPASRLVIAGGVLQLGLAAVGANIGGLPGLGLGWVIALCAEAIFMVPLVYRVATGGDGQPASVLVEQQA
jgi:O-antigen/teichoic acid export membrane protein